MRIIYIHQYFLTPEEGGAIRSYYLAKGLAESGMDVEMITSHNKPYYDLQIIAGVKVHYLPVAYEQEYGFLKRVYAFLKFVQLAKKWIKKLPRPDLLYISSTPLTTGLIGLWAKRKLALPYTFEVRDLWPDAPVEVGAIRNPLLKKFLYNLEAKIYQQALKIVALSPGIANAIRRKTPDKPIHLIPNFSDTSFFTPQEKKETVLEKYGLRNTFTIAYTGAVGKVNAVEELLDLAKTAQDLKKDIQFVVMGKGSHLTLLLEKAKKLRLENFHWITFGNKEKVREVLGLADMAYISFDHLPVLKTNSPNKFFDALAMGKAILVNHKGWVYDLVKDHQLGIYYNPSKKEETLEKLMALMKDPIELRACQQQARKLAEESFSAELAVGKLIQVLDPKQPGSKNGVYILTA